MSNEKREAIYIRFSTSDYYDDECNYEEYFAQINEVDLIKYRLIDNNRTLGFKLKVLKYKEMI